jgi:hypothetical protein
MSTFFEEQRKEEEKRRTKMGKPQWTKEKLKKWYTWSPPSITDLQQFCNVKWGSRRGTAAVGEWAELPRVMLCFKWNLMNTTQRIAAVARGVLSSLDSSPFSLVLLTSDQ